MPDEHQSDRSAQDGAGSAAPHDDDKVIEEQVRRELEHFEAEPVNPYSRDADAPVISPDARAGRRRPRRSVGDRIRRLLRFSGLKLRAEKLFARVREFIVSDMDAAVKEVNVRQARVVYRIKYNIKFIFRAAYMSLKGAARVVAPVLIPVLGLALICVCVWGFSRYRIALRVYLDGRPLDAYVENGDVFEHVKQNLSERLYEENNNVYYVDSYSTAQLVVVEKDSIDSPEDVFETLYENVSAQMGQSYGVFVDGSLIGCLRRESEVLELESYLLSAYVDDPSSANWSFVNDFRYVRDKYDSRYVTSYSNIVRLFNTPAVSVKHTVSEADTAESIVAMYGITVPVLRLLNPGVDCDNLAVGTVLEVGAPRYMLSVAVDETFSYSEIIPYSTVTVESDELYEGFTAVTSEGVNGMYDVQVRITEVNGVETSRTELSRRLVRSPLSKRVTVGTKTVAPSGYFIFPLESYQFVSSYYGWRTLRGVRGFHRGIDIAAVRGTEIYAADAGTVVFSGWDEDGLGYCVKIDHGNGITSVYGHCSRIAEGVEVGVGVGQGQVICYVGSTGNSTGNHLHFALCYTSSGEYFDPYSYIRW